MPHTVLILDDNESLATALAELLERRGFAAHVAPDTGHALDRIISGSIDLLLLDVDLGEVNGANFLRELRRQGMSLPVLLVTARQAEEIRGQLDGERVDIVEKPISIASLLEMMSDILLARPAAPAPESEPTRLLLSFSMDVRLALASPEQRPLLSHPSSSAGRRRKPRRAP